MSSPSVSYRERHGDAAQLRAPSRLHVGAERRVLALTPSGPLLNGTTTLCFEGVPTYPDAGRLWEVVDKYKASAPPWCSALPAPRSHRAIMCLPSTCDDTVRPPPPLALTTRPHTLTHSTD